MLALLTLFLRKGKKCEITNESLPGCEDEQQAADAEKEQILSAGTEPSKNKQVWTSRHAAALSSICAVFVFAGIFLFIKLGWRLLPVELKTVSGDPAALKGIQMTGYISLRAIGTSIFHVAGREDETAVTAEYVKYTNPDNVLYEVELPQIQKRLPFQRTFTINENGKEEQWIRIFDINPNPQIQMPYDAQIAGIQAIGDNYGILYVHERNLYLYLFDANGKPVLHEMICETPDDRWLRQISYRMDTYDKTRLEIALQYQMNERTPSQYSEIYKEDLGGKPVYRTQLCLFTLEEGAISETRRLEAPPYLYDYHFTQDGRVFVLSRETCDIDELPTLPYLYLERGAQKSMVRVYSADDALLYAGKIDASQYDDTYQLVGYNLYYHDTETRFIPDMKITNITRAWEQSLAQPE